VVKKRTHPGESETNRNGKRIGGGKSWENGAAQKQAAHMHFRVPDGGQSKKHRALALLLCFTLNIHMGVCEL